MKNDKLITKLKHDKCYIIKGAFMKKVCYNEKQASKEFVKLSLLGENPKIVKIW